MFIRSKCVLGETSMDGQCPIWPGDIAEIDDKTGRRVIAAGYAEEVLTPVPAESAVASQTHIPNGNTSENENASESRSDGIPEVSALESMTYTELKAMAKGIGIETGRIKSKAGMIEAITQGDSEIPADDMPELTPQDVIEA